MKQTPNILMPLKTFGIMTTYRRKNHAPGEAGFAVFRETDGKWLEDFRRSRDAIAWAKKNRNG